MRRVTSFSRRRDERAGRRTAVVVAVYAGVVLVNGLLAILFLSLLRWAGELETIVEATP
jgi:hypothetical protein